MRVSFSRREASSGRAAISAAAALPLAGAAEVLSAPIFRTSSSVMRPSGPLPATLVRSTPRSAASRFARGDAITRLLVGALGAIGGALRIDAAFDADAGGVTGAASPAVSPRRVISPSGSPTPTTAPSSASTRASTPPSGDSISTSALSGSTVSTASPWRTWSPVCLCHFTTVPSVIVWPSLGIWIVNGIFQINGFYRAISGQQLAAGRVDFFFIGNHKLPEHRRGRNRHVGNRDSS